MKLCSFICICLPKLNPVSSPPKQQKKVALLPLTPLPASFHGRHSSAELTLPKAAPLGLCIKVQVGELPHECCEGQAEY